LSASAEAENSQPFSRMKFSAAQKKASNGAYCLPLKNESEDK
jgi:hypothetical protein